MNGFITISTMSIVVIFATYGSKINATMGDVIIAVGAPINRAMLKDNGVENHAGEEMSLDNLEPCPFCGDIPKLVWNDAFCFWQINHEKYINCIASSLVPTVNNHTLDRLDEEYAISTWNARYKDKK